MAIFYDYIKGVSNTDNSMITQIYFPSVQKISHKEENKEVIDAIGSTNYPVIRLFQFENNAYSLKQDLGEIVTTSGSPQYFLKDLHFGNDNEDNIILKTTGQININKSARISFQSNYLWQSDSTYLYFKKDKDTLLSITDTELTSSLDWKIPTIKATTIYEGSTNSININDKYININQLVNSKPSTALDTYIPSFDYVEKGFTTLQDNLDKAGFNQGYYISKEEFTGGYSAGVIASELKWTIRANIIYVYGTISINSNGFIDSRHGRHQLLLYKDSNHTQKLNVNIKEVTVWANDQIHYIRIWGENNIIHVEGDISKMYEKPTISFFSRA